jgi:uncharacterized membrane protein YjjB (DUF3815 family)
MLACKEPANGPARTEFLSAYLVGKTVVGIPRWRLYLIVIFAIVVGNIVRDLLVYKYSIPRSEAFVLASIAVALYGLTVGLFLRFAVRRGLRREIG